LSQVHVFPYSPRPDTPAARMPQLPPALVRARASRLRMAADHAWQAHLQHSAGLTHSVLTERGNTGRTEGFTPVAFPHDVAPGQLLQMAMTGHDGKRLLAAKAETRGALAFDVP
jgi:threonylcarbamoyladenosine tRNA methylthiotransferase MtaB